MLNLMQNTPPLIAAASFCEARTKDRAESRLSLSAVVHEGGAAKCPIVTSGGAEATEVNSLSFPDNLSYVREEITYTIYDDLSPQQVELNSTLEDVVAQFTDYASDNTRNRINGLIYQESYDVDKDEVYNSGIFYDYDVHGNVKELLQVNNYSALLADEQNLKRVNYEYDLVSGNVKRVVYQNGREDQFMHRYVYDADNRIRGFCRICSRWI